MVTNLEVINQICTDLGGTAGHVMNLDGENEICTLLGGTGGHVTELAAINEICTLQGVTDGHVTNLSGLNAIAGDDFVSNLAAWNYIQANEVLNKVKPPSGLTLTGLTTTSIKIDWTDNSNNEDSFKIERSTDGVNYSEITSVAAGSTTYTNGSLTSGTVYYYRVRAYSTTYGYSNYCTPASTNTQYTDYTLPLSSTGTGVGVSTLQLTVNNDTTITLTGNGYFYDDAAGTINQNQSRTLTAGAIRTFYLKVTSGNSTLTVVQGNGLLTQLNRWDSSTNAASINGFDIANIPDVTTVFFDNVYTPGNPVVYSIGNNTITGDLSSLKSGLISFNVGGGTNTITGDLSSLPSSLLSFSCGAGNTIYGNISSLPSNMTFFRGGGSTHTISGDLSLPSGIIVFICGGLNTISGTLSLPSGIRFFNCTGYNTLSGVLSLPNGIEIFTCQGYNTLSGVLSLPNGIVSLSVIGYNTLSGTLIIPNTIINFALDGRNTINNYVTGQTYSNSMNFFQFIPYTGGGLTANMIDNLIIDLNGSTWAGANRFLNLIGTNAARTVASNAAVTSLTTTKSVTVTTNP